MLKIKNTVLFIVVLIMLSSSPLYAAVEKTPGVPKNTPFLFTIAFDKEHKDALSKIVDQFSKNQDSGKALDAVKQKVGISLTGEAIAFLKNMTQFSSAVFFNEINFKERPNAVLMLTFASDVDAAGFIDAMKNGIIKDAGKQSAELSFSESGDKNVKIYAPALKSKEKGRDFYKMTEPRLILSANNAGIMIFQKSDEAKSSVILKSITAALANEKETMINAENFKAAFGKNDFVNSMLLYMDGAVYRQAAIEAGRKDSADFVKRLAFSANLSPDMSKVTTFSKVSLGDIKDKNADSKVSLYKVLFSPERGGNGLLETLPQDVAAFFTMNFNFGKDFQALPEIASSKDTISMTLGGIKLDEDIFSWMSGEFLIAIDGNFPEFYFGIGSKDNEKAMKFFEKFQSILKIVNNDIIFKDETLGGLKVKTCSPKTSNPLFKDKTIAVGIVNKCFLVASKAAFEKMSGVKPGGGILAAKEFSELIKWNEAHFGSVYVNYEKMKGFTATFAEKAGSEFGNEKLNSSLKYFAGSACYKNNELTAPANLSLVPDKINESITEFLASPQSKEFLEMMKVQ